MQTRSGEYAFATLGEALQVWAVERPHDRAFVFLNGQNQVAEELTFAALDRRATIIAEMLMAKGLVGKRVLLAYPPGLEFIAALFGCFYAGAVAVPVPYLLPKRSAERVEAIGRDCDAACALTVSRIDRDLAVKGVGVAGRIETVPTDTLSTTSAEGVSQEIRPDSLAILQYTSGSTSAPKGVMLTHLNLVANSSMIAEAFGHDQTCCGVTWLPLFHDMGLVGHVLQPIYGGALSVLLSPLSFLQRPLRWLQAISDWKATTSGGPTYGFELCSRMVNRQQAQNLDLSTWKVAYCGSERVGGDVLTRFAARFQDCGFSRKALYPCYGLAEATLFVSGPMRGGAMRMAQPERSTGDGEAMQFSTPRPIVSCGRPWGDASLLIVDPQTCMPCPEGIVGEIWSLGPHIGLGYWDRPRESDATFQAALADGDAGWLRTGDLGFLRDGELFVVGRLKEAIVIRGLNHDPQDIEETVRRSHPDLAGHLGAAFSVEVEGEEHAVVVQETASSSSAAGADPKALTAAFSSVTREHGLRLHALLLVRQGALPRTSSGKIQRARSRAMYLAEEFVAAIHASACGFEQDEGAAVR